MKYVRGLKYQLAEDETYLTPILGHHIETREYELLFNGECTLRAGYAFDGSTGAIDTKKTQRAAAFHDALCLMIARGQLPSEEQEEVDQVYKDICEENGVWEWMCNWRFSAIRFHFGGGRLPDDRKVVEVP